MLIDCALEEGGSFYLTYHRLARKDQMDKAYPRLQTFLDKKRLYDLQDVFTIEWYRHYCDMFF